MPKPNVWNEANGIIQNAVNQAMKKVEESHPELSPAERNQIRLQIQTEMMKEFHEKVNKRYAKRSPLAQSPSEIKDHLSSPKRSIR